jgi:AcrR family transcriptional regulator
MTSTKPENKLSSKRVRAIAKAAAELFSTKGYIETSMDDIAAAAKISKGGLYHYFRSKAELLTYIVFTFMDEVLKNLSEQMAGNQDTLEKIRTLIFHHVEVYTKNMYAAKILLNEAYNLPPKEFKKIKVKERQYYQLVAGVASDYLGTSVSKDEVKAVAFSLLGMCNWIYSWYNPRGPIAPAQLSQVVFDIFTNGINSLRKDNSNGTPNMDKYQLSKG